MPHFSTYLFIFAFGAIIGSFSNVCIYRIPLKKSIIYPSSFCPSCETPIKFYHNLPIISYLFLSGRCPSCSAKIALRYPLVELLTALIYIALFIKFGLSLSFFIFVLLSTALIIIAFIDLENRIIPDIITLPGIIIGFLFSFITISPQSSALGILVGGGLLLIVSMIKKGGMGGGDIKLMAMVGAFLGLEGSLMTILIGSVAGSVIGIALIFAKKKGMRDTISFGPFLSFGAIIYILIGQEMIFWYLSLVGLR